MTHLIDSPTLPLPKPGQLRAYWRVPASASALAVVMAMIGSLALLLYAHPPEQR